MLIMSSHEFPVSIAPSLVPGGIRMRSQFEVAKADSFD